VSAPTVTLTANPTSVPGGGTATLTWSTTNAVSCTATGGWSGSKATSGSAATTALTASTSYTLTCDGSSGTTPAAATATVTVSSSTSPPAPTVTLKASPTSVPSGGTATLTWSTTNAVSCTATGGWSGSKATSGSAATTALTASTSYTLTCDGASGTTPAAATATVTMTSSTSPPAPTVTLKASPAGVLSGSASTLTWSTTNAVSCTATGGWSGSKATSGSVATAALTATTSYTLNCAGAAGTTPAAATATVSITNAGAFTVTPRNAALTLSQSQQFSAAVPGGGAATWSVDGVAGGSAAVGMVSANGLYVPPATPGTHSVLATSVADPTKSGTASVAVTDLAGVYTFHNDLGRTGQNLQEYALTPATVSGGTFGKRWSCPLDGEIYAQPLFVANLAIGGGVHNVVFLATQNDSIYAIDADDAGCVTYWHKNLLGTGVTTISYTDLGGCNDITQFGITGTPVIDPVALKLYFVAATEENGSFVQRLHALNIETGAEPVAAVAIQAQVAGSGAGGSTVSFSPLLENQRAGLALYGGGVFISWASHCDIQPYWGWTMRYDAASLAQTAVFNVAPNGVEGGIWMSAGAPAVDAAGRLFLSTGNGTFDDSTNALPPLLPDDDFSMSFLNFNPATLTVQDFYTPSMEATWNIPDLDIAAAGVTVLPDAVGPGAHPNLLVGSDKQSHLWLIDREHMSGFNATSDNTVQFLTLPDSAQCPNLNCVFGTPAYYNQTVYMAPSGGPVMALPLTAGLFGATAQAIAIPSTLSAETYAYPGATAMISASPAGNGIVWVLDNSNFANQGNNGTSPAGPSILRAYNAANLGTTLYSSSALAADTDGNAVKFTVPVIANGHVYVGGGSQLTVYGLAP
jgi:hypothetical protein